MFYARTKGQSTLEYVILIGFVVAALIAMGVYMKRGTEGKLRESTDRIGEQYEAGRTTGVYNATAHQAQHEVLSTDGSSYTYTSNSYRTKCGFESVDKM